MQFLFSQTLDERSGAAEISDYIEKLENVDSFDRFTLINELDRFSITEETEKFQVSRIYQLQPYRK